TPIGRRRLLAYHWPGNVRELAHEVERAIVFEDGPELGFPQLGPGGPEEPAPVPPRIDWLNPDYDFEGVFLDTAIDRLVPVALQLTNVDVAAAGRVLGVPREYMRYRLYGPRTKKESPENG